jgi:GAF domain-containing protein
MEIIQQKLIWVMGNAAALILLYKLKLGRAGMRKRPLLRMKIGVILLLWGSLAGIAIKTFFPGSGLSLSGIAFFMETILGYTAGWVLVTWGLISWAMSYFDLRGKPLTTAGSKIISDIILKSLTRGDAANLLFNSLAGDLFSILECQAATLHIVDEDNRLRIAFHKGLTDPSAKMLEYPRGARNVFLLSEKMRQAVISDESHTLHDYSFCETTRGVVSATISLPVTYNGQLFGVLSAFRTRENAFNEDDMKVLEIAASGLGASLRKQKSDREYHQETRFKELLIVAARPLDSGQPMVSAIIKSAKIINDYLPFKWICLYIQGNGTPRKYEFNLPTGGAVKIVEGWLSKPSHPHLFNRDPHSGLQIGRGLTDNVKNTKYIFPVGESRSPFGYLEFEFKAPPAGRFYLPLLGNMLGKRFAHYLKDDKNKALLETYNSWIGAQQYFQRKAAEAGNVSSFLNEIASSIVDLTPVTFCRILLANPSQKFLKTSALAQKRNLAWNIKFDSEITLSTVERHRNALESGTAAIFNQADPARKLVGEEASLMIPAGIKCGAIIPLIIESRPVGLLTVGDCRNAERVSSYSESLSFLRALAGMISIVLSWHKEKRISLEGNKKLTLLRKDILKGTEAKKPSSRLNSRINGPLASILAACEYLKSGLSPEPGDINRFLESIERNASQIHQITSTTGSGDS